MRQQQQEIWEANVGNSRTFSVYLAEPPADPSDNGDGDPITGAVVEFSIFEADGSPLAGATWPVVMTEVGAPGWYSTTTAASLQWQNMIAYRGQVEYAGEVQAVPPIVAYDRTLQQPTQSQLRIIAKSAGLSI